MNKPTSVPKPTQASPSADYALPSPSVSDVTTSRHAAASLGNSSLIAAGAADGSGDSRAASIDILNTSDGVLLEGGHEKKDHLIGLLSTGRDAKVHEIPSPSGPSVPWYKTLLRFIGPGAMISVGYMDPGNWATDLSGGSQFYYNLLFCILLSNIFAVLLQSLAVKAGIVTGRDLAQLCRHYFHPYFNFLLYITAEAAIIATDLAEVIGAAIALNLLFKLPLPWGVAITGLDVLIILMGFGHKYLRWFEFFIMILVGTIGVCFVALLAKVDPIWKDVFSGYVPRAEIFTDPSQLFIFMGIVGATVMPHNLYLHTHLVLYRYHPTSNPTAVIPAGTIHDVPEPTHTTRMSRPYHHSILLPQTLRYTFIDCLASLTYALFVNSSILIVAAAAFYTTNNREIATIEDAYNLLSTLLGPVTATLFAVALLCSGQSSTITGTIAGQVVMGGFLGPQFRLRPWARRLISRTLAIIPALVTVLSRGSKGLDELLVISQVVLSCQLPFAVWPLVYFTSRKAIMTVNFKSRSGMDVKEALIPEIPLSPPTPDSSSETSDDTPTIKCFANHPATTLVAVLIATMITGLNIVMLISLAVPGLFGKQD